MLSLKKFHKIRQKKIADQPDLLVDTYYVYDNISLMQDTYTAKKLYNRTQYDVRQTLRFKHKYLSYQALYQLCQKRVKSKENLLYRQMHLSKAAQNVIRHVANDWHNYFKARKAYYKHPGKFTGKPCWPNYVRHPRTSFELNKQSFSCHHGYLQIHAYQLKLRLYQHYNADNQPFQPVYHNIWVIPVHHGVKLCCSYENPSKPDLLADNGIYVGIDPGVDNMFACVCNQANKPMLINGRPLKAINQWANKSIAKRRELLAKYQQNSYHIKTKTGWQIKYADSNRIQQLFNKRNCQINDAAHKAIMSIINYAQNCDAHTIVIGKNKFWKRNSNMSKRNNQNFIGIPHALMIKKLAYRAAMFGIAVITTNESYTSQTSFLDHEKPVKQNGNKIRKKLGKTPINRRFARGLFRSNQGCIINADVNAALQIIKKVVPQVSFGQGIEVAVLHPYKLTPSFGY